LPSLHDGDDNDIYDDDDDNGPAVQEKRPDLGSKSALGQAWRQLSKDVKNVSEKTS